MPYDPLWKYCTPAHCRDFLLSLDLLGPTDWAPAKQLGCLYALARHPERHYRTVLLSKPDGGFRQLDVPDPLLRRVQRNILRRVLSGLSLSPHATAYRSGISLRANAAPHVHRPQVLTVDIKDFFGSIAFPQVYSHAFPAALFPPSIRMLLTNLCCLREHLPQGAPTSPAISNRIMRPFDARIAAWCAPRDIAYTRYCDDMAFSGSFDPQAVLGAVRLHLGPMGLSLNPEKTRHRAQGRQQRITGIVVNERAQVSRQTRRTLRQAVHYCSAFGTASHLERLGDTAYLPAGREGILRYLRRLLGQINHVLHVNPADDPARRMREAVLQLIRQEDQH